MITYSLQNITGLFRFEKTNRQTKHFGNKISNQSNIDTGCHMQQYPALNKTNRQLAQR